MSNVREILTLQFGNYANYVGTHWWNIQESGFSYDSSAGPSEICHDVLYREGVNHNRQTTYTPRLLLVDLDGSLKHLPREGELYGNSLKREIHEKLFPQDGEEAAEEHESVKKLKEDIPWQPTNVEIVAEKETKKHEFQEDLDNAATSAIENKKYNLADNTDSWADFLYGRYHPRTVHIIKQYRHDLEKQTFDTFGNGVQLWKTEQFEDDFCDRIRQYVEECDFIQGFQTLFDAFNGFGGMATQCMEHLNDEYGKANLAVPLYTPKNVFYETADEAMSDSVRVVNSALAFSQLIEQANLFVPLSTQDRVWRQLGSSRKFNSIEFRNDNLYQTSAILASYLDTISLRYRLKDAPASNTLAGFCGDMTNYGRKFAAAAFNLPFTMEYNMDLIDCLDKFEGPLFTQLTPNCKVGSDYVIQSLCVRGIPLYRLKRPREACNKEQMRMAAYRCESVSEMFQLYLQCSNHSGMAHVTSIKSPMPTRLPYPDEIFGDHITESGFIHPSEKRPEGKRVNTVPCVAAIQSSSELGDTLENLHREAKRIKIAKLHRFKAAGLEDDDYVEVLESLLQFKDNYEDNFEL
ncbi:misato mitochondrial distribution and morphology regulator [Musca autumnalis]|uniref:misato mitochondrial distribution and morphology regulator n=1 Tax=Musca autumnalis TaxID=221902 RepID=UPI003CF6AB9A